MTTLSPISRRRPGPLLLEERLRRDELRLLERLELERRLGGRSLAKVAVTPTARNPWSAANPGELPATYGRELCIRARTHR